MRTIYYLGPKGSYTNVATKKFIDYINVNDIEYSPFFNIKQGFYEISKDDFGYLVVPIENMIRGTVRETLDNLLAYENDDLKIVAETTIDIEHCIISYSDNLSGIKNIISHPQALSQCSNYIYETFGDDVNLINSTSTSLAVENLKNYDKTYCAISNQLCAQLYNVPVLAENISNVLDNKTRFFILSKQSLNKDAKYKTAISFSTENKSGALANVLKIFADLSINLLHIDSRPSKIKMGEYLFYCELDGALKDKKIFQALYKLQQHVNYYKFNGSYIVF